MSVDLAGRAALLASLNEAEAGLHELADLAARGDRAARARIALHEASLREVYARAAARYVAQLPRRSISRCPHSGEVLALAIDDAGIDGRWWCADNPLRPAAAWPRTLFSLSGALLLTPPIERAPFLVAPGPARPFVIRRLLEGTKVVAVVSSLPIGRHQGFAIAYYAPEPPALLRAATWGVSESGSPRVGADDEDAYDYDLGPWLDAGRLRWIAPGDASLGLREGRAGCPYLAVPGRPGPQRITDGEVRS